MAVNLLIPVAYKFLKNLFGKADDAPTRRTTQQLLNKNVTDFLNSISTTCRSTNAVNQIMTIDGTPPTVQREDGTVISFADNRGLAACQALQGAIESKMTARESEYTALLIAHPDLQSVSGVTVPAAASGGDLTTINTLRLNLCSFVAANNDFTNNIQNANFAIDSACAANLDVTNSLKTRMSNTVDQMFEKNQDFLATLVDTMGKGDKDQTVEYVKNRVVNSITNKTASDLITRVNASQLMAVTSSVSTLFRGNKQQVTVDLIASAVNSANIFNDITTEMESAVSQIVKLRNNTIGDLTAALGQAVKDLSNNFQKASSLMFIVIIVCVVVVIIVELILFLTSRGRGGGGAKKPDELEMLRAQVAAKKAGAIQTGTPVAAKIPMVAADAKLPTATTAAPNKLTKEQLVKLMAHL